MSPKLQDRSINVFVYDAHGNPVPGALVTIKKDDIVLASAITTGRQNSPSTLQYSSDVPVLTLSVKVRKIIPADGQKGASHIDLRKDDTFSVNAENVTFQFPDLDLRAGGDQTAPLSTLPPWFPIAGFALLVLTVVFLMALVIFKVRVECDQRGIVVFILALTTGGASAFLGGTAAAKGHVPFWGGSVFRVALAGGVATVIVVILIGFSVYVRGCEVPPRVRYPEYLNIGTPTAATLQTLVNLAEKAQNVTILFGPTCGPDVPKVMIDAGTHEGNTVREFLEALQLRARPPVHYRVTTSGAHNERHEIVCY